jgi:CDP-diacylglycerol--glycerol-3-phosphate 3-phosphatidyltransferase
MRKGLEASILRTVVVLWVLQAAVFAGFGSAGGFAYRLWLPFCAISTGFHAFLYYLLMLFRSDFCIVGTETRLEKVNLANLITLFRVSSLPTLLCLVLASRDYVISAPIVILAFLIFASDFVDGWVSRSRGQVTRMGKMLDSTSDYAVLVSLTIAFWYYRMIDFWFFALVMGRLGLQTVFVAILYFIHGSPRPRTTLMGKAAIASIMVLYGLQILRLILPADISSAILVVEIAAGAVVAVSVIDKVLAFAQDIA